VITAENYKARPDLVNCGRTLFGAQPTRGQQGDLNYFAPIPGRVEALLHTVQNLMLQMGCPVSVAHNEVAPGQHEMSPIYCVANASCDYNVLFMEVANKEAVRQGLAILFHEKPFAGINGSGKHSNWSIGTDTGLNFFHPGKHAQDEKGMTTYVTALACVTAGLHSHNEVLRCAVACAGNDHRLGAQEAPPAIMSIYPGQNMEKHIESIIEGGPLIGYMPETILADVGSRAAMPAPTNAEDRNRTAPFPWCGNRFEFRAVGSSQGCSFPVCIMNTMMASGMSMLSSKIEGGMALRDAVAELYSQHKAVIFTGNGYGAEWPVEAERRGLPNLRNTPAAITQFTSDKAKALFSSMKVLSERELEARAEVMWENYNTVSSIEARTMIQMVETDILPACAKDLKTYMSFPGIDGGRTTLYSSIKTQIDVLARMMSDMPEGLSEEASHFAETVIPQMAVVRALVDEAEGLINKALYPYPTYETLVYEHHT